MPFQPQPESVLLFSNCRLNNNNTFSPSCQAVGKIFLGFRRFSLPFGFLPCRILLHSPLRKMPLAFAKISPTHAKNAHCFRKNLTHPCIKYAPQVEK